MVGIHGKNVVLRISTNETVLSGVLMGTSVGAPNAGQQFWMTNAAQRNWKYDIDRTLIQWSEGANQGHPELVDASMDTQTRLINFAYGAVELGPYPGVVSGVYAMAVAMELTTVGNLIGDARNFTLTVITDTIDSTTIGEPWKNFADGLQAFEGSLDGLYIDEFWYKQAIATLSGVIPQRILKFIPNPLKTSTYYQGTCIFPQWEITGGFDSIIEHSVPIQGRGALDLVVDDAPFFNLSEMF